MQDINQTPPPGSNGGGGSASTVGVPPLTSPTADALPAVSRRTRSSANITSDEGGAVGGSPSFERIDTGSTTTTTINGSGLLSQGGAGKDGSGGAGGGKGIPKEGLLGSGTMPAVFAEAGMEHARNYGTTFEQFAKISVKNHHHSTMNPKARYQIETPLDEVMNAEMISYPNTKLMCSVNVDGAAAAIWFQKRKLKS